MTTQLPTPRRVIDLQREWPHQKEVWRVVARYAAGGLVDPESLDGHAMPDWWPENTAHSILAGAFNAPAESTWQYFCALILMAFREGHELE